MSCVGEAWKLSEWPVATIADGGTRTCNLRFTKPLHEITKPPINQRETHRAMEPMAHSGALPLHDTRLDDLVKAWPILPEAIKAGIAALVQAAKAP